MTGSSAGSGARALLAELRRGASLEGTRAREKDVLEEEEEGAKAPLVTGAGRARAGSRRGPAPFWFCRPVVVKAPKLSATRVRRAMSRCCLLP